MKLRALVSMARASGPVAPQDIFEEDDAAEAGRFIEAGYAEPLNDEVSSAATRETATDKLSAGRKKRTKD